MPQTAFRAEPEDISRQAVLRSSLDRADAEVIGQTMAAAAADAARFEHKDVIDPEVRWVMYFGYHQAHGLEVREACRMALDDLRKLYRRLERLERQAHDVAL